jgi:hypothetical protein
VVKPVEPLDEGTVRVQQDRADRVGALRDNDEKHSVREDAVPAELHSVHADATTEQGQAETPVKSLHGDAQVAAHSLLHEMEHPRDLDAGDVAHGA